MIDSIRSSMHRTRGRRRKLTDEQVLEYRARYARGETAAELALGAPVGERVMLRVVTGLTYKESPWPALDWRISQASEGEP